MAAEAPTGTVTFLFTDIEGSTRLWEEHGDAMAASLARHDEISGSVFDSHGGYVFATGGDGFAVAFGRAANGLAAAAACQEALATEDWDGAVIRVRMGLHVGEAEERDGDYFGPAVNKAARVMAAGHGGQILATEVFAQVVDADGLAELGEFRLRDLSGPQRVFQVGEDSFPRLRTIDAYPSNLPQSLSTFVGREEQVAQVVEDLGKAQLVTLTGTGGVGKTRLAVQACAEALPIFPGGAWFVDLATVRDPEQIAHAVASALDVKERAGEAMVITVRDYLRDRDAVVLFDNGEHLVDALADLIEQLRSREIAAKFLVTSREPLGIDGEQVRRVVSLDADESADLFVQRAASVRKDIDWGTYGSDVGEICERLDGIPLAIELAAARTRSMMPSEILARLDERFRLLSGGRRTARQRHQTLSAAVEWSYDLLADEERAVFDRLAVFRGGFFLAAAEAVCSGKPVDALDVVDQIDRLVDKSMVVTYEVGGQSRYRLLETLREFAESKLFASGTANEFRDRQLEYYRDFIGVWSGELAGGGRSESVAELLRESTNIDAALGWLADCGRWDELRGLCSVLKRWWTPSAMPQGPRWYGVLVDNLEQLDPADQALALAEAGHTLTTKGEPREGRELADRSLAVSESVDAAASSFAYSSLAFAALADGDQEAAAKFGRLAEEAGRDEENPTWQAVAQTVWLTAEVELQMPVEAKVEEFAAWAETTEFSVLVGTTWMMKARMAALRGDHAEAEEFYALAIETGRQGVPSFVIHGVAFRAEGRLRSGRGDTLEGVRETLELFADTAVGPHGVVDIWVIVATMWLREGRVNDAAVLASAAGALLAELGVRGSSNAADLRQQLGDELAAAMSAEELDAHISTAQEMTADDVRRFIFERL